MKRLLWPSVYPGLLALCPGILLSCASPPYQSAPPRPADGRYDSEFPSAPCSDQLEVIGRSVQMLSSIGYYKNYPFSLEEKMTLSGISEDVLDRKDPAAIYTNATSSGSSTVIYFQEHRVALLTCAHVVAYPDTVVTYYIGNDRRRTPYIQTIALKQRQTNYIARFPEGGMLDILAIDQALDVAILGKRFVDVPLTGVTVFSYPMGKARDLEWGSFLYLFGFPGGQKMLTKGIVSITTRDKAESFFTDAGFARGFSGGIALAIRDGVPHFELVGIVKMVTARTSYGVVPSLPDEDFSYDPTVPYRGDLYVERETEIQYGVTQAISIEAITAFVRDHDEMLRAQGYALLPFFERKD